MFGLDLITIGILHLAAVNKEIQCQKLMSPKISVLSTKSHVRYNYSLSTEDLNRIDIDTVSPYGSDVATHVGGIMSGDIYIEPHVDFFLERYPSASMGCVHIRSVHVRIDINPTIYIASNYSKGSCEYNAILNHEKKHAKADQLIVSRFSKLFEQDLRQSVQKIGVNPGPFPETKLVDIQKNIQTTLDQAIKKRRKQMNSERYSLQQAIDSEEEYQRVAAECF